MFAKKIIIAEIESGDFFISGEYINFEIHYNKGNFKIFAKPISIPLSTIHTAELEMETIVSELLEILPGLKK